MNRLVSVTDRDGEITAYTYDANGNRSSLTYPNGNKTTYTYDNCNRLVSLVITDRYSNIIEQYDYTLGTAGERLSVQETNRTIHYTYDNLYRLTQETIQDGALDLTFDYTYDAVGNRLTKTDLTGTAVYTYNALNQLILENDTVYTYDDNGALISVSGPDRSAAYTYNDLGRMSTATVTANGTTITESYLYDWAGTRTAKITDGVLTYYLVDTGGVLSQVLAELDHTGALITHFTRGAELISLSRPGEKRYYIHDGQGSVRALSDADGQVTDTYLYDAFGNLLSKTGTTANDFLYTGEQYDTNTGFYYLRARYMNPSTGTFTSPDAYAGTIFDPVSLHKYLYANANPVMNRDPSGNSTIGEQAIVFSIRAKLNVDQTALIATGMAVILLAGALGGMTNCHYANINASLIVLSAQNQLDNAAVMITIVDTYLDQTAVFINSATQAIKDWVREKIKSNNLTPRDNSVYVLSNPKDKYDVWYVGITNNPARRLAEHGNTEKAGWPMTVIMTGLTRLEARILEQLIICTYTIKSLENLRYEISKGNYGKATNELKQIASLNKLGGVVTLLEMTDILNHD